MLKERKAPRSTAFISGVRLEGSFLLFRGCQQCVNTPQSVCRLACVCEGKQDLQIGFTDKLCLGFLFLWRKKERKKVTCPSSSNSPLAQQHGMIPHQLSCQLPSLPLLSPPSKLGAPGCLQPACTGLLIGNRAAAHLLIESRLGPWGRAVKQAPRGIKS